ncbi:MAG: CPBP family intramembrane glutamic endopeptidase [Anaerolineae bacterium]|jgi:membrane protease YdiL (CAAX protease family)|nr:CPBP family intramembrane glutamic endopeptidase [Anaerolineae bacterium]
MHSDSQDQTAPAPNSRLVAVAWALTLLTSPLSDILYFEIIGAVPAALMWIKALFLGIFILRSRVWRPLKSLGSYALILLALVLWTGASAWLAQSPAWATWQARQSFTVAALALQSFETLAALTMIGLLLLLLRRRQNFFLIWGDRPAMSAPLRILGEKAPEPLWRFGAIFTLVVIIAQVFMFILPLAPTNDLLRKLVPLIPLVLLLAASNSFNEELLHRAAPLATLIEVIGKSNAIWMAAVTFGLAHYIGGAPSGIPGVLITAFLGWFFGKAMADSRGFFWPWLFHTLQDILPFAMMALAAL